MSATDAIGGERLEALLRGDAPRSAAESRRAALLSELRAAGPAPEMLRERVLAGGPSGRAPRLPSRRLALVLVPAAVGVAVAAALVHGLVGSGSSPVVHGGVPVQAERSLAPATPSVGAGASGAATKAAPVPATQGRLQHTDASLQVRVPAAGLAKQTSAATKIVTTLGGYAQSVVYDTPAGGGGSASLELRVPAQNVKTAVARLGALGTIVAQRISVTDLEQKLASQSAAIAQLRRKVAALQQAVADPSLPDAQRVLLRIRLAEAKRALAQRLAARKGTVAAAANGRISLVLTTAQPSVVPPPPRGRLGRMLHSAVGFLGLEGTVVLYALVVLSPLLVLAALARGLALARRRRDERRLLAA